MWYCLSSDKYSFVHLLQNNFASLSLIFHLFTKSIFFLDESICWCISGCIGLRVFPMIRWLGVMQDKFSSSAPSDSFANGLLLMQASTSVKTVLNSVSVSIAPWSVFISGFSMVLTTRSITPEWLGDLLGAWYHVMEGHHVASGEFYRCSGH